MNKTEKQNTVVTASAGTGKTYRLVSEFVDVKIHPRFILALTFTDKAAAEMRTRIGSRDPSIQRFLSTSYITTYHSFCANILREFADRVGIDSRFKLLDPFEEKELARKVAKQTLLRGLETGDVPLSSLVARLQLEGTNDTKGVVGHLIRMREQLIESGESPQTISRFCIDEPNLLGSSSVFMNAIEETRRAFYAYEKVWSQLSENSKQRVTSALQTFEQLQKLIATPMLSTFEVSLSSVFDRLRKQVSGRFGPDELRKALVGQISHIGMLLCASFLTLEESAFIDLLKEFWFALEVEKKQSLCLGFSDLLVMTRRMLRDDLVVRRELKTRFQYVLVDEYQDTSPIQEDLVALLCETLEEDRTLEPSQKALGTLRLAQGKLFVVGDPKQSIYGFRGADVSLFMKMADEVSLQGGRQESLNLSRRSSSSVVQIVNAAVPCQEREKLEALREGFALGGAVLRVTDEAKAIAAEIAALLSARSSVAENHSFEPKDVAVLVRRVKKAGPILRALLAAGVPARIWGGEGFFERQEVVELVSALALTTNPSDSIALLTVMRSPFLRFPDFDFAKLFSFLKEAGYGWTLDAVAEAVSKAELDREFSVRFEKLHSILVKIAKQSAQMSLSEALQLLLDKTDYCAMLAFDEEASLCFANLRKLQDLVLASEGDFKTQIDELTLKVRRSPKEALGEEEVEANAVRIMTIHQSKGLEFPVVFVADTSATIPSDSSDLGFDHELGVGLSYRGRPIAVCAPSTKEWVNQFGTPIQKIRARQRERSEEELSCLLYVALTRARDLVYFLDVQGVEEKTADRGCTLRKLFFQGYDAHEESMQKLMPVLSPTLEVQESKCSQERENAVRASCDEQVVARQDMDLAPSYRHLLYASDLQNVPARSDGELRSYRLNYVPKESLLSQTVSHAEMGRLGHRLLQLASEQLVDIEFEDELNIRSVLSAGLRLEGHKVSPSFDTLIQNCIATLETVILPLRKAGFNLHFEMPMQYQSANYVVRGFADAVAIRQDQVCVIDFKSSLNAAQSIRTKLQLMAYCASILQDFKTKQVFFSACVIGHNASLDFLKFDADQQRALDENLGKLIV